MSVDTVSLAAQRSKVRPSRFATHAETLCAAAAGPRASRTANAGPSFRTLGTRCTDSVGADAPSEFTALVDGHVVTLLARGAEVVAVYGAGPALGPDPVRAEAVVRGAALRACFKRHERRVGGTLALLRRTAATAPGGARIPFWELGKRRARRGKCCSWPLEQ